MMKVKKWGALAASAILAAGMMTGCSLGSGGSLDMGSVNQILASIALEVSADSKLDGVVAGVSGAATAGMDQGRIAGEVAGKMNWSIQGNVEENVLNLLAGKMLGSNPEPQVIYGTTLVVREEQLKAGVNPSELGLSNDTAAELLPIDTVDKVAAAMVLRQNAVLKNPISPDSTYKINWGDIGNIVGGVVDQGKDWVENNKDEINDALDKVEDAWNNNKDQIGDAVGQLLQDKVTFAYHASAYPMMSLNGSAWIVSVQVTATLK